MSILFWALIGLIIGLVAGFFVEGYGTLEDSIVGAVGGIIGGWLGVVLLAFPLTHIHPASAFASMAGASLSIALSRGITRGRTAI